MKNIRRSVFETNSSSTHCLSVLKSKMEQPIHEELFTKAYMFAPFSSSDAITREDYGEMKTFEDRVRFLCTMVVQGSQYEYRVAFLEQLKRIFPNSLFQIDLSLDSDGFCPMSYIFEDLEYFMEDFEWRSEKAQINKLLENDDLLKHIIEYGEIRFASRDFDDSEKIYRELEDLPYNKEYIAITEGD